MYRDICCLEVHFVFVTFACLLSYKLRMAESQRGGERDIDIESRRELIAVANNSAVSERIVALKKSKAGHLGELKKIYRRLDEYLTDHKFAIEVREDSHRLDNQWKRYSHVYYDLIQLLHESERMFEKNRYAERY